MIYEYRFSGKSETFYIHICTSGEGDAVRTYKYIEVRTCLRRPAKLRPTRVIDDVLVVDNVRIQYIYI